MIDDDLILARELEELFLALYESYGYDFRSYAKDSLKKRVLSVVEKHKLISIQELKIKILNDKIFLSQFVNDLTIGVTELFRGPLFYKSIAENVIPFLKTFPRFKIWHAGCSSGEEVYSMVIMLKEEGILDRAIIYGTDINMSFLDSAKKGIVPVSTIKRDTQNYFLAGRKKTLSEYFYVKHEYGLIDQSLLQNVVFSFHNLATDYVFSEVQLVICRNVLIYFDQDLKNKVLKMFSESLCRGGYMGLGNHESLIFSDIENDYLTIDKNQKIYLKKQNKL